MEFSTSEKSDIQNFCAFARALDGKRVLVRAIKPSDKELLLDETSHMSQLSMYYRYFVPKKVLSEKELIFFTEVDFKEHVALIAMVEEGDGIFVHAGCGRYIVLLSDSKIAEIAFDIKDEYQGHGIGTILFNFLCQIARSQEIYKFRAEVLTENAKMLEVFAHSNLAQKSTFLPSGVTQIDIYLGD